MLRPCPKCGNRNHISAFVCPCGNWLIGWQETSRELQPQLEKASAAPPEPRLNIFPAKSPSLPEQPSLSQASRHLALEMQKQAIREALVAEELESQKPANRKLKVNLRRLFVGTSLVFVIGAMLALFGGFASITENSKGKQNEKEPASLIDTSPSTDSQYLSANSPADKNSVRGKVIDVGSGDTLTVADYNNQEYRIKLEGIDAPEIEQQFGREAQRNLFALVFGKTVQVFLQKTGDDNFAVGKVLLNGKNVSLEQLKAGLAWHDKNVAYQPLEDELYAFNETDAQSSGLGLWAAANPIPPWEYRNKTNFKQGENKEAASDTNREFSKAVAGIEPKAKTIVQEKRDTTESQTVSIETATKPASVKSPTSVGVAPPKKVLTPVLTSYEHKTIIVPRSATARCGDGTLSYNTTRSGNCAGRGGVADWFNGTTSSPPPAKTTARPRKYNPAQPRRGDCYVIDGGKKVYLDRAICGN